MDEGAVISIKCPRCSTLNETVREDVNRKTGKNLLKTMQKTFRRTKNARRKKMDITKLEEDTNRK